MGDYNPRQITQMRWKDAKELEKFKFISGEFGFVGEVLEQASKHKPWSKIVEVIKNGSAYKPILIFDISNNEFYFGTQENDTLYLQTLYANQGYALEIQYNNTTDKLTITSTEENYLTENSVKTIFGQSISGTGNITMYNHQILVNDDCYFNIILTNDLLIDSPQDLTTALKPTKTIYYFGFQKGTLTVASLEFDKATNLWKYRPSNDGLHEVTTVTDMVTSV